MCFVAACPSRSIQLPSTGTSVLDSRYDAPIEKPTASDSGKNSDCAGPVMKNDGRNTAKTLSIAKRRGVATSRLAARIACARVWPSSRCTWIFSSSTVPSSTRTPTASASPPSVMMLIV
jgi:hypothetical protein